MMDSQFYFLGKVSASKSLLNRALIVKSYFEPFQIEGSNSCDDVNVMKEAISCLKNKNKIDCGLSGTAFRFLSLRLSRIKGTFFLEGRPSLLRRPLHEVTQLLSQLSVETQFNEKGLKIISDGWKLQGDYINVPTGITSQWASGLVLNGWELPHDLYFSISKNSVSSSYFKMTLDFVKNLGLEIEGNYNEYCIKKNQTLKKFKYKVEQDKSSLFVLAALASLKGKAIFTQWDKESLQPDNFFPEILKNMNVKIKFKDETLEVYQSDNLNPIHINLNSQPDIFPVLAILCAKAKGQSKISGLSHLAFKESHRIIKIKELLSSIGVKCFIEKDSFFIEGGHSLNANPFVFDTNNDHRIAMASSLLQQIGIPISIKNKETVSKSFPEFFKIIEGR